MLVVLHPSSVSQQKGPLRDQTRNSAVEFSVSTAALLKAQRFPFGDLEISSPEVIHAEGAWGFWASHNGVFCPLCLVRLTSSFSTVSSWDPPATPETEMDSAPTGPNGIRGHCAPTMLV